MVSDIDLLSTGQAAKFLRVSVRTIQRWDKEGKLVAKRNRFDRRQYTREQLTEFVNSHHIKYRVNRTTYFPND